MDKTQKHWRKLNPQLSVCVPVNHYEQLFTAARAQRYRSLAHFVRAILLKVANLSATGVPLADAANLAVTEITGQTVNLHLTPDGPEAPYLNRKGRKPAPKVTPPGTIGPRSMDILVNTDVYMDHTKPRALPQLPGIPAGLAHSVRIPDDDEPEDITAEAARLV